MGNFIPRTTRPEKGNKYYIRKETGGWNSAIKGSPTDSLCDVLANCVGYAYGRFNEILKSEPDKWKLQPRNAELWADIAKKEGLEVTQTPSLGAVMVWQKGATLQSSDGAGHVAVVERVISNYEVITSESGYNAKKPWWMQTRMKGNGNWGQNSNYKFLGFIKNPGVTAESATTTKKPTVTLKEGSTGDDVKALQTELKKLGYYGGEIDGIFGLLTLGAVCAFQLKNSLVIDGSVGPKTRDAIWR